MHNLYTYIHLLIAIAKRDKDRDFNSDRTEASMPGQTSRCSFFPSFITLGVDNQLLFFFSIPSYLCNLVRKLTTFLCIIMEYFLQDLQTFAKLKYVNMDMWYYSLEWTGECRQFRWFINFSEVCDAIIHVHQFIMAVLAHRSTTSLLVLLQTLCCYIISNQIS